MSDPLCRITLTLDDLLHAVEIVDLAVDAEDMESAGPLELTLRTLYADGRIDDGSFRALLDAHRREEEASERARTLD